MELVNWDRVVDLAERGNGRRTRFRVPARDPAAGRESAFGLGSRNELRCALAQAEVVRIELAGRGAGDTGSEIGSGPMSRLQDSERSVGHCSIRVNVLRNE